MGQFFSCCGSLIGNIYGGIETFRLARAPNPAHQRARAEAALSKLPAACGAPGLILAVDFTSSNKRNGEKTFGGRPLHQITLSEPNLYERAIAACAPVHALSRDRDTGVAQCVRALRFGDIHTRDECVVRFLQGDEECANVGDVANCYRMLANDTPLSGPTSYVPTLRRSCAYVDAAEHAHALVLLVDGAPANLDTNTAAFVEASALPLYVVAIGVGDGPFTLLASLRDSVAARARFPNFDFVELSEVMAHADWETRLASELIARISAQAVAARAKNIKFTTT